MNVLYLLSVGNDLIIKEQIRAVTTVIDSRGQAGSQNYVLPVEKEVRWYFARLVSME